MTPTADAAGADELREAAAAVASLLAKCEAAGAGARLSPGRRTLLDRRVRALRIAARLIERELAAGP